MGRRSPADTERRCPGPGRTRGQAHHRDREKPTGAGREAAAHLQVQLRAPQLPKNPDVSGQAEEVRRGPLGAAASPRTGDLRAREVHEGATQEDHRCRGQADSKVTK